MQLDVQYSEASSDPEIEQNFIQLVPPIWEQTLEMVFTCKTRLKNTSYHHFRIIPCVYNEQKNTQTLNFINEFNIRNHENTKDIISADTKPKLKRKP